MGALTVIKAFCDQINLHQATMLPIFISQSVDASYNISPWNNTQICGRPLGGKSGSNTKPSPEQRRGDKRNPTTPPDAANDPNSSNHQKQKKPKRGVKVDTVAKERKDLGMFFLKNPSINPFKVFPKVMPEKICANFTCKGKECSNASCDFIHPRKPSELKHETIIAIADHFNKTNIGWFNEYHFMKMPDITDGVKKLLGNTRGIPVRRLDLLFLHTALCRSCWNSKTLFDHVVCLQLAEMNPSSPPKLVRPAQSTSISFDQALSNKLHSSLVLCCGHLHLKRYKINQLVPNCMS